MPTENLRFREVSLVFKVAETATEEEIKRMCRYEYPNMKKTMGKLNLIKNDIIIDILLFSLKFKNLNCN